MGKYVFIDGKWHPTAARPSPTDRHRAACCGEESPYASENALYDRKTILEKHPEAVFCEA